MTQNRRQIATMSIGILLFALLIMIMAPTNASHAAPTPGDQQVLLVDDWRTIVKVDDDSERGVRIYKGVNCTTPAGAASPVVIKPGFTSAAVWKEPISVRYYGSNTSIGRNAIDDGAVVGPVIFPPDPADPNVGRCYPANSARLTVGVEYTFYTQSAT